MHKDGGFTLIELVITLVVSSVIFAALSAGLAHIVRDFTVARCVSERMAEVDAGLSILERFLRKSSGNEPFVFDPKSGVLKSADGVTLLTDVSAFDYRPAVTVELDLDHAKETLTYFNFKGKNRDKNRDVALDKSEVTLRKATIKMRLAEDFEPLEMTVAVPGDGP